MIGNTSPTPRLRGNGLPTRCLLGVCLLCVLNLSAVAFAAPPTLTHLFPAGGQRGTKVVVTCAGTFTWPPKVWAPGIEARPMTDSGKLEVTIPADLPADRVWIRLYDAEGASVRQPFLIGGLSEIDEVEPNDKIGVAQSITAATITVNGALKDADVDCFAVTLVAGQTLVAAIDANTRIGSPMDSVLQIVSTSGIVLAENHDDLNLDPRLAFVATETGTYIVRVFAFSSTPNTTIRFNGGTDHIYRLTLTTGPYFTHSNPLSVSLAAPGYVVPVGWNIPPETRLNVVLFGGTRLADQQEFEPLNELRHMQESRIGFASLDGIASSTRVRMVPESIVHLPASADTQKPTTIPISSSVTGYLKSRRQVDDYRISLTKGQHVVVAAEARSLNVPLDLLMKLADPTGAVVAEVDDTAGTRDSSITHVAAHDGEYRITVADRFRQGGDRCWYLLTVRPEQADFELSSTAEAFTITHDKPTEITVKVQRRGTAAEAIGPIEIQAISLPPCLSSTAVVSETTGPTASEVKLTLTSHGTAFSGPVRIAGTTTVPKVLERFARTPTRLDVAFDTFWLTVVEKPK